MDNSNGEGIIGFIIIILIAAAILGSQGGNSTQDVTQQNPNYVFPTPTPNPETWRLYAESQYFQDVSHQLQNSQRLVSALQNDIAHLQGIVVDQNVNVDEALQTIQQQLDQAKAQAEQDKINQKIQLENQRVETIIITMAGAMVGAFLGWMSSVLYNPNDASTKLQELRTRFSRYKQKIKEQRKK